MKADQPPELEVVLRKYRVEVESKPQADALLMVGLPGAPRAHFLRLNALGVDGGPVETLLVMNAAHAEGFMPRPVWVVFMAESYYAEAASPGALDDLEHGELAERKAIGMAGVEECIVVEMAHRDGRRYAAVQQFTRKPALDAVEWGELRVDNVNIRQELDGRVPRALAEMVGALQ